MNIQFNLDLKNIDEEIHKLDILDRDTIIQLYVLSLKRINRLNNIIEKAVEYIENNDFGIITFSDRDINGNLVRKIEKGYVKKDELLNILNGKE